MGKKNKKMVEWQDDNKPAERPKREDISKAFAKKRSKRPIISSSRLCTLDFDRTSTNRVNLPVA